MKSTLADNKQLFNVKAIAVAGLTPTAIPEGQLGVIDEATGLTVVPANLTALPDKFVFVSKLNGKVYYSFDTIEKAKIKNKIAKPYVAPQINIWKTTIESCNCINGVQLTLNIDEASLIQRDGLTWTHRDLFVEVAPQELKCFCDCSGKNPTYENNVLTMLLVKKVNDVQSAFYEAEAGISTTGVATGTAVPPATGQVKGDLYIRTGATAPGLYVYDGTAWVLVGTVTGTLTNVEVFVESTKDKNTDGDDINDGPMLELVIKGKVQPAPTYHDLEVNYVYPRGVKLNPALTIDGKKSTTFTQIQALVYELGAGYDMRAEEWENFNNYTNLNHYTRLSDGIQNPEMKYQFENNTNYNTITFEFYTDKVEINNGDKRLFGVLLGTSVTGVFNSLKAMFGL